MARNIMETEHPKEIQEVKEAVEQRNEPRASKFEAIGIPNPQPEVEPEQFKVLFKPEYALQPENYPAGGIRGFYNHCFDRLNYQQKSCPMHQLRTSSAGCTTTPSSAHAPSIVAVRWCNATSPTRQ
ncbi:MAG: hypothetical protein IPP57_08310 [Candidatus Obscuribacter sp.]|nr:hypothetical protein [Candidatus Obscuribacter sp.]